MTIALFHDRISEEATGLNVLHSSQINRCKRKIQMNELFDSKWFRIHRNSNLTKSMMKWKVIVHWRMNSSLVKLRNREEFDYYPGVFRALRIKIRKKFKSCRVEHLVNQYWTQSKKVFKLDKTCVFFSLLIKNKCSLD